MDYIRKQLHVDKLAGYVVYIGFVAILLFFAIALHDVGFLSPTNLMSIVRQTTPITIMAVGMVFAMSTGQIDLSIGAVVALSALVTALTLQHFGMPLAILAGLTVGAVAGFINGMITVTLRIPSLLVTLGTMGIIAGLARWLTNLESVPIINDTYTFAFGSGDIGPISVLFIWAIAAVIAGHLLLNNTVFGRHVLATGGEESAASAAGINTIKVKVITFMICGMSAALAGMLYAGRLHGARYSLGEADLLTVIAATVIGGTSLFGGKGSVVGAILGSWIMGILNNGLILMGFSVSEQMMARGTILIFAVALSLREAKK